MFEPLGLGIGISQAESRAIQRIGLELNKCLKSVANQHNWHFVDVVEAFGGRGYCDPDRYFVRASESLFGQGDIEGVLHPNDLGAIATANEIAGAVSRSWKFDDFVSVRPPQTSVIHRDAEAVAEFRNKKQVIRDIGYADQFAMHSSI